MCAVEGAAETMEEVHAVGDQQQGGNGAAEEAGQPEDRAEHIAMEEVEGEQKQKAPSHGTLQTNHALIVKGFIGVVPPEPAEQPLHQAAGGVLESGSAQRADDIQHDGAAHQRPEGGVTEHGAEAVNDAEGEFGEAPVFPHALFAADDHAFHAPADEAVQEEHDHQHVQRDLLVVEQAAEIEHHRYHPEVKLIPVKILYRKQG